MSSFFKAVPITVAIGGAATTAQLLRYKHQVGGQPAEAEFTFPGQVVSKAGISGVKGKSCVLTINGTIFLTGYIVEWRPRYEDAPPGSEPACDVVFTAVDKRWLLSGDYIGRQHLDTLGTDPTIPTTYGVTTTANGIAVLGADINFNRQTPFEHANMDASTGIFHNATAPKFVYEKADTGDATDCSHTDSAYWTYGDAIFWILSHYATVITQIRGPGTSEVPAVPGPPAIPAIPPVPGPALTLNAANFAAVVGSFVDLARTCEDIDVFGMPVDAALDELFSRTNSNWFLDGTNCLQIFSRAHPLYHLALKAADPLSPLAGGSKDYDLTIPCSLRGIGSIRNVVSRVDIIGGTTIREINAGVADFLTAIRTFDFTTVPPPIVEPIAQALGDINQTGFYFNFNRLATYRIPFDHSKYAAHKAGKNTRAKDIAKPLFGELLVRRDINGNFVNPDNECGIQGVSTVESLLPFYHYGSTTDLDRSQVDVSVGTISINANTPLPPPSNWVMPVETEIRAWVEANVPLATLPFDRYAAVVRDDLRHKNREIVHIPFPVEAQLTWNVIGAGYTILQDNFVALPAGATKDYTPTGSFPVNGSIPAFTISLPAGVVFDAIAALTALAQNCTSEIGRERCDLEGSFPVFRLLPLGTQLTLAGGGWTETATGQECVVAVHFDGTNQEFGFAATNYIGPNAMELAKGFVARSDYRRGV